MVWIALLALISTSYVMAREHWSYAQLAQASANIATLTAPIVNAHATGTLSDSDWAGPWQAQSPGSLASLSKDDLRRASVVYYLNLPTSIDVGKRVNARDSYLEWLISRWNEDRGC